MLVNETTYAAIKTDNVTNAYKVIKSDLQDAENSLIPILGEDFYAEVLTSSDDYANASAEMKVLVDTLRLSVYNLAIGKSLDFRQVQISDSGVNRTESGTIKTAYRYQKEEAKAYFLTKGYEYIEAALRYLEANTAIFLTWFNGEGRALVFQFIIPTATAFNQFYNIRNSRLTYLGWAHIMRDVEWQLEESIIGADLAEEIRTEQKEANLSPDNSLLIERYLGPYIAYTTVAMAMTDSAVEVTPSGVFVNHVKAIMATDKEQVTAPDPVREAKMAQLIKQAEKYSSALVKYLNENASASKYAAYFNSTLYSAPSTQSSEPTTTYIYGAL